MVKGITLRDICSKLSKDKAIIFILDVESNFLTNEKLLNDVLGLNKEDFFSRYDLLNAKILSREFQSKKKAKECFYKKYAYNRYMKENDLYIAFYYNGKFINDNT